MEAAFYRLSNPSGSRLDGAEDGRRPTAGDGPPVKSAA